jgi:tetratricopeptide (TPR) repeat protein
MSRITRLPSQLLITFALLTLFPSMLRAGQGDEPIQLGKIDSHPGDSLKQSSATNVYVSVREPNGLVLTEPATIKLFCPIMNVNLGGSTKGVAVVQFSNIPAGDCFIEVSAPGYKATRERAAVVDSLSERNQYFYVYLHLTSESANAGVRTPVSLNVLREMDKGTEAIRKNRPDEARKHLLKASESAPQNPDVQYLLGLLEAKQSNSDAAKTRFERAVALYPTHEHALLALGELQLHENHVPEATATLERAVGANTMSYRAQFLLGAAYMQQRNYASAKPHTQKAVELGADKLPMANVLLGQILAGEGNREAARKEFEKVMHDYPKDTAAGMAKQGLDDLEKPAGASLAEHPNVPAFTSSTNEALLPSASPGPIRPWAPADVDSSKPGVATDVACSEAEIVKRASQASAGQLDNFEKFMASEHIEHEDIDRNGNSGHIRARDFSYLVFIDHDKSGQIFLNESRDGGTGIDSFPTSLATVGLLGLGVDVFHPGFASALEFRCEGLGQWRGKAAWVMHFSQRPNRRSYLRLWETQKKTVEVPLKGRVWVAATTYEILHIETDLREPISELELARDHLEIDYGPVSFQNGKTELWLPWSADMYLELHHKRYHYRHSLSKYSLFAVDTTNKINNPKGMDGSEAP